MPRHQPFTLLCQQAAELRRPVVADLHLHTTASDGDYTPSQVVILAAQARLAAVAITDHDTMAGYAEAEATARQLPRNAVEVIAAIEMSATFHGTEFHVLAYFVDPANAALRQALAGVCERRRERFRLLLKELANRGITVTPGAAEAVEARSASVGRRHLASLLVQAGVVRNRFSAFQHHIRPASEVVPPTHALPFEQACSLIHDAGGVAVLAHPPDAIDEAMLTTFRSLGLRGVEAAFPAASVSRTRELREAAGRLGLVTTGGSDCHGPDAAGRAVGAKGVTGAELAALRALAT